MSAETTGIGSRWMERLVAEGLATSGDVSRGRGMNTRGALHEVSVEPGLVSASVAGRGSEPRRASVGFARVANEDWTAVAAVVRSDARWQVAVVEGRLPDDLLEAAAEAGVTMWLDSATTSVDCSCERGGTLCTHALALCDHIATMLDDDPLLVVTLRNGDRGAFIEGAVGVTGVGGGGVGGGGASTALTSANAESTDAATSGGGALVVTPRGAGVDVVGGVVGSGGFRSGVVSPILTRGDAEFVDAAPAWRRSPSVSNWEPSTRRLVGRPRLAATPPPAELGVSQRGIDALAADAVARASAALAAIDGATAAEARTAAGLGLDRDLDMIRLVVAGRIPADHAASRLDVAPELLAAIVAHWPSVGPDAFDLLARPRRLSELEVEQLGRVVDGRLRTRSTGVLLDDGRQIRRAPSGRWAIVATRRSGRQVIEAIGEDLVELLDGAEVDLRDPDR